MENKKLGFIILSFSVIATVLAFGFMNLLGRQSTALQCYSTNECQRVESMLGLSLIGPDSKHRRPGGHLPMRRNRLSRSTHGCGFHDFLSASGSSISARSQARAKAQ